MIFPMPLLHLHTSLQLQEEERPVKINYSIIRKKNQSGAPHPKNRELRPTRINIQLTT
jgi:hypothetical protein